MTHATTTYPVRKPDAQGDLVYSARAYWVTFGRQPGARNPEQDSCRAVDIEFLADGGVNMMVYEAGADTFTSFDLPTPYGERLYALLFG